MSLPDLPIPPRSGRTWFRLPYQFSLRTLLVVTTLAAVGCWWFLQPKVLDEELAGKYLTLRRQIGTQRSSSRKPYDPFTGGRAADFLNVGSWRLRDEHGDLFVAGRYRNDQPHGWWTAWHASGRKAAEGEAQHGVKAGVWRTWDDDGHLVSEVTYTAVPFVPSMRDLAPTRRPFVSPPPHHPRLSSLPLALRSGVPQFGFQSLREGPARQWYANGQLEFEGNYKNDRREGAWTFFDEQGQTVEQGTYVANRREGWWLVRGQLLEYVAGRTKEEHEKLLERIVADLDSSQARRQIAAAAMLEELGPAGAPLLEQLLRGGTHDARRLALRSLVRQDAVPEHLASRIEPLVDDADPRLSMYAMLAIYPHRPERRGSLHAELLSRIKSINNFDVQLAVSGKLCELDAERLPQTMEQLIAILARRESTAPRLGEISVGVGAMHEPLWEHLQILLAADIDLVSHLERAINSRDVEVRLLVAKLLKEIVESHPPTRTANAAGSVVPEYSWEIPEPLHALIQKAKSDSEPKVREIAAGVGRRAVRSRGTGMGMFGP
jgi:hypothetical protein